MDSLSSLSRGHLVASGHNSVTSDGNRLSWLPWAPREVVGDLHMGELVLILYCLVSLGSLPEFGREGRCIG